MGCSRRSLPIKPIYPIWTKAYLSDARKPHLISHVRIKEPKFFASYEKQNIPSNINCLLQHAYANTWFQEHNDYLIKRRQREQKHLSSIKIEKKISVKKEKDKRYY